MPYEIKRVGGVTLHVVDGVGYIDCEGELVPMDIFGLTFWVLHHDTDH